MEMANNIDYAVLRQLRYSAVDSVVWAAIVDVAEADDARFAHAESRSIARVCKTPCALIIRGYERFFTLQVDRLTLQKLVNFFATPDRQVNHSYQIYMSFNLS